MPSFRPQAESGEERRRPSGGFRGSRVLTQPRWEKSPRIRLTVTRETPASAARSSCVARTQSVFRRKIQQQAGNALVRLLKRDGVELGRKHADGLRQVCEQIDGELWLFADAFHETAARNRYGFGALQRFCRRNARQAVKKSRFPENAAGFQDGKRFFRTVFRAEKDPDAAAFQVIEFFGVASLPVDHFSFFVRSSAGGTVPAPTIRLCSAFPIEFAALLLSFKL